MKREEINENRSKGLALLKETIFENLGSSDSLGGAIYESGIDLLTVRSCVFLSCAASEGGAICIFDSLSVFYSFFYKCSAAHYNDNGGNAIRFVNSTFDFECCSYARCAEKLPAGDSILMGSYSMSVGKQSNFTLCSGYIGECSIAISNPTSESSFSYHNVIQNNEWDLIALGSGFAEFVNFIDNKLDGFLVSGYFGIFKILKSIFFGNVRSNIQKIVTFKFCYGDIQNIDGITYQENKMKIKIKECCFKNSASKANISSKNLLLFALLFVI